MTQCDQPGADTVVVLDFETTGLYPHQGDRAIEIGAVLIRNGEIKGTFQELMNPGFPVSPFITELTGITNSMLSAASPCDKEGPRRGLGDLRIPSSIEGDGV